MQCSSGNKNDCKYVESTEQSNAPAEPTEQSVLTLLIGRKRYKSQKSCAKGLRRISALGFIKFGPVAHCVSGTISAAKKDLNIIHLNETFPAEKETHRLVKAIRFTEMCHT